MMEKIILVSMVVACVSFTISDAKIFKPFRDWIKNKSDFLGRLFRCAFCFSFYPTFLIVWLLNLNIFLTGIGFVDYFFTSFVIVWMAAFQWIIFCILLKIAGK